MDLITGILCLFAFYLILWIAGYAPSPDKLFKTTSDTVLTPKPVTDITIETPSDATTITSTPADASGPSMSTTIPTPEPTTTVSVPTPAPATTISAAPATTTVSVPTPATWFNNFQNRINQMNAQINAQMATINSFKPQNQMIKSKRRDNFCLDVPGFNLNNEVQMIVWDCNGGRNQQWTLDGSNRLVNTNSGKCLDVYGGFTENGTSVNQYDCHDGTNQKWDYDAAGRLHPRHAPNKCLDINASSDANGAKLHIWDCHDGLNQKWYL